MIDFQESDPLKPVGDGRDGRGRFTPGNKCGAGNPLNQRVQKLRAALVRTVKPADVAEIVGALVGLAKGGDVAAAKVLLAYTIGRPESVDVFHHAASAEPTEVRVVVDPNWYGNRDRLAALSAAKTGD